MARLSTNDKCTRVLLLLLGLRYPEVARALMERGFDAAQLARGWALLARMTDDCLEVAASQKPREGLLRRLDAWENRWLPIVEIALRLNHPRAHELVFRNIRQTSGIDLVATVSALLDRLDRLARPVAEGGLGEEGERALALLRARGASDALALGRALLEEVGQPEPGEDLDPLERERAERELWAWYLEWSGYVRLAVKDRRILRSIGFLRYARNRDDEP